eukprot:scaffold292018_cov32-Tisochrysis_lutea.AAC.3
MPVAAWQTGPRCLVTGDAWQAARVFTRPRSMRTLSAPTKYAQKKVGSLSGVHPDTYQWASMGMGSTGASRRRSAALNPSFSIFALRARYLRGGVSVASEDWLDGGVPPRQCMNHRDGSCPLNTPAQREVLAIPGSILDGGLPKNLKVEDPFIQEIFANYL